MLQLDSKIWERLEHAYGSAEDIPNLILQLRGFPSAEGAEAEPYFSLWSALCHQGDVYSASYSAVPHIVSAIKVDPIRTPWTLFHLVTCIEISRAKGKGPKLHEDQREPYEEALKSLPALVGSAAEGPWDEWYCGAGLAAIAAAKGFTELAEAILELDSTAVTRFLAQVHNGPA